MLTKEELKKNLDKIELHYNNWLNTVGGTTPAPVAAPAARPATPNAPAAMGTPIGATGGWSIRPKP